MKFAFCVEDDTDELVFARILTHLLGAEVTANASFRHRLGGFDKALGLARAVACHAHRSGLDGALFAIDNDGAPQHGADPCRCRPCRLRAAAKVDTVLAWPRPALPPLRYLFAVPVEAIETWLLILRGDRVDESVGKNATERKTLKRTLYGVESPDRTKMTDVSLPLLDRFDAGRLAAQSPSFSDLRDQVIASMSRASPPSTASPAADQA